MNSIRSLKINNQSANFQQNLFFFEVMRNLLFPTFFFFVATLILSSFSEKTNHSGQKELKRLRVANDSLVQRLAVVQAIAEEQAAIALEERRLADINYEEANKQRQIADWAQEEALVQAERAILASDEALKYRLLAEEHKKKLEACKDNQ